MAEPEDLRGGLPDIIRSSDRPIIIYQGPPPGQLDPVTSNAVGVLSWLSLLTVCLVVIGLSFWAIWNPGRDQSQYSPVYEDGRPRGLSQRVEERRQINKEASGLMAYLERVQSDNFNRRRTTETHRLITGAQGIDELRRQWDAACRNVRARIYDRRIGTFDTRIADLRRRARQTSDPAARASLTDNIAALQQQRRDEIERRRTDADPSLRCTPAAEAPVCAAASTDPWCNPERALPGEFAANTRHE